MGDSGHVEISPPTVQSEQKRCGEVLNSPDTAFSGRYNQFQRTMLQWSGLHPYNAVHAIRVGGDLSPARFEERLNHVLDVCGLGKLSIDPKRGTYRFYKGNPGCPVRIVEEGTDPSGALRREIEWQLNEAFPFDEPFPPFRFFIVPSPSGPCLGIAYFHAVADAESVARLLIEIVRSCFDEEPGPVRDNSLRPLRESRVSADSPLSVLRQSWAALRRMQAMRSSYRPPRCQVTGLHNVFADLSLSPDETAAVLSAAKHWNVTVNDLCLAALLLAIAPLTPERFLEKRPRISVGCVVNLRGDIGVKKTGYFGLFLGSFTVAHEVPEGITLRDLAENVHAQTLEVKRLKRYFAAPLEFMISRLLFGRVPPKKQCNFYRKTYPLWGSITNMKMDGLYRDLGFEAPLDYYRAVSAGPAMPLVIAVTGTGGRLNFGYSYRPAAIPTPDVERTMTRFTTFLNEAGGAA